MINHLKSYFHSLHRVWPISFYVMVSMGIVGTALLLDEFDIPSEYLWKISGELRAALLFGCVGMGMMWLYQLHFFALMKVKSVSIFDGVIWTAVWTGLLPVIYLGLTSYGMGYKMLLSGGLAVGAGSVLLYRIYICGTVSGDKSEKNENIFDLYQVCQGNFAVKKGIPIRIVETDVDYDLLDRGTLIDQVYRSIVTYSSQSSFVIGLEGKWGSGKTTLINQVKRRIREDEPDNMVVIEDFDPWVFGSQEAMLISMYDVILKSMGITFSIYKSRRMANYLCSFVANSAKLNDVWKKSSFKEIDSHREMMRVREEMGAYLRGAGKTVVVFIDNIDRAEADNVILLFKAIGTVFNLPGIVYVLSYDKERVDEILKNTKKINPKYIEKIIQQEIKIPEIQVDQRFRIYGLCIQNILLKYGIKEDEIRKYTPIVRLICSRAEDLRTFKRLINSAFMVPFFMDKILNKRELLALETIRFLDWNLYEIIRKNPKFFISHDKYINTEPDRAIYNKRKFNEEGKAFFEQLFQEYGVYQDVLSMMFPYVRRFLGNYELESEYPSQDVDYGDIERNASICSAKFFDLYFSYGNNAYLSVGTQMRELIEAISGAEDSEAVYALVANQICSTQKRQQKEWFERLQNYLEDIPQRYCLIMAKAIIDHMDGIDSSMVFWAFNAQGRAEVVAELLLERCRNDELEVFIRQMTGKYEKMAVIGKICYFMEGSKAEKAGDLKNKREKMQMFYHDMCIKVLEEKIDLYSDSFYRIYNIWGLHKGVEKDEDGTAKLQEYHQDCFCNEHIYRILGDAVSRSIGMGYGYEIKEENMKALCLDEEKIEAAIAENPPKTESERFIMRVYEQYKKYKADQSQDPEIWLADEIRIEL